MGRLLLHSTLVLVVLLLSAAGSHAEERNASGFLEGGKTRRTKEETALHDEEEDDEGGDETELQGADQKDKAKVPLGAGSRMILTNALQSSSFKESESPEDAKKQREMALRVRELLSRLPIIPLSQQPVLHKETLVATAPTLVSGASDDPEAAAAPTRTAASETTGGLVFPDLAGRAHPARIAAPHHLENNAFISHDVTDEHVQTVSPAASVTTPLYGGHAPTQAFPGAFAAGDQDEYQVSEVPLPYYERSDDAAETPGTTGPQPGKDYPTEVSRADMHFPEAPQIGAPAEFVQLFGIMNALSTLVDWVDSVRKELNSRESDARASGGEDTAKEKGREEDAVEEVSGRENMKNQSEEEAMDDARGEKVEAEDGYKTLSFGHHPEN